MLSITPRPGSHVLASAGMQAGRGALSPSRPTKARGQAAGSRYGPRGLSGSASRAGHAQINASPAAARVGGGAVP